MSVVCRNVMLTTGLVATLFLYPSNCKATPITDWAWAGFVPASAPNAGRIRNVATDSPILGSATPTNNDAASLGIFATFPQVSLVNNGDTVKLSGSFTIEGLGAAESPASGSIRIGLYDDQTVADDNKGWVGFHLRSVSAGATIQMRGVSAQTAGQPTGNTGAVTVGAAINNGAASNKLQNATYNFELIFGRSENDLVISGSIVSADQFAFPYSQIYAATLISPPSSAGEPLVTYDFDRVALDASGGGTWSPDIITFSNIDVTYTSVPETSTFILIGCGVIGLSVLRRRTLRI